MNNWYSTSQTQNHLLSDTFGLFAHTRCPNTWHQGFIPVVTSRENTGKLPNGHQCINYSTFGNGKVKVCHNTSKIYSDVVVDILIDHELANSELDDYVLVMRWRK